METMHERRAPEEGGSVSVDAAEDVCVFATLTMTHFPRGRECERSCWKAGQIEGTGDKYFQAAGCKCSTKQTCCHGNFTFVSLISEAVLILSVKCGSGLRCWTHAPSVRVLTQLELFPEVLSSD